MPDKKLTDNEIIKALQRFKSTCIIRMADMSWSITIGDILDLIKRYEAEIESKNDLIHRQSDVISEQKEKLESIYSEVVKEFAERLNKEAEKVYIDREGEFVEADGEIYDTVADWCKKTLDNIVKETVGK